MMYTSGPGIKSSTPETMSSNSGINPAPPEICPSKSEMILSRGGNYSFESLMFAASVLEKDIQNFVDKSQGGGA
jgi:hypothetical protein